MPILADGFEDAFAGYDVITRDGEQHLVAVYNENKCVEILMERDGMELEDAVEYFEFKIKGANQQGDAPYFTEHARRYKF
jgi:hypothetical protein